MKKIISSTLLFVIVFSASAKPGKTSKFIKVDQFGYMTQMPKVAVITDPVEGFDASESFSPGEEYELRDFKTDAVIFKGKVTAWNNGKVNPNSGDKAWWFDFSKVTSVGEYYVWDPKNNVGSYGFVINDNVYDDILKAATRAYYYNRCNFPKERKYVDGDGWVDKASFTGPNQDTECRSILDPQNPNTKRDLSGGWWDAGDYNKYTTFTLSALNDLLEAYLFNPEMWPDNFNIPESGNGIPDIVDEIKYELDWLMKMQYEDGGAILKMGNLAHSIPDSIPATLPPSTDRRWRFYYPQKSSAAAISIARVFSHAAYAFKDIPQLKDYCKELTRRAILSFEWFEKNPMNDSIEFDNPQKKSLIQAGLADLNKKEQMKLHCATAIYLFALTGEKKYNDIVYDKYVLMDVMKNWWGPYDSHNADALLAYTKFPQADKLVKKYILQYKSNSLQYYDFYGFKPEMDAYRAFQPASAYHWGSNQILAEHANINMDFVEYDFEKLRHDELAERAAGLINHFHGINPFNMVYMSNMYMYGAEYSANEVYHTWFHDGTDWDNALMSPKGGPAPGFIPGGANKDFSIDDCCKQENGCWDKSYLCKTDMSMVLNQPPQKSYLDYNTSWPLNSWAITEPGIYYQAAYIKALSQVIAYYKKKGK
jgi:hypothetical protein